MMTTEYPIREIFRLYLPEYRQQYPQTHPNVLKAAEAISRCKTGELGYNVSYCPECGTTEIHAVSCNNRNCPCCQSALERKWELERNTELIKGIAYYHVVFTIPEDLNGLIRSNPSLLGLLFSSARDTLISLCKDKKFMGAKPGIISVLHTWGQKLNYHPHLHVCISGGGITPDGRFVETPHKGFFIPLPVLAASFRGRYMCALKRMYDSGELNLSSAEKLEDPLAWKSFVNDLFGMKWIPFVKETFNGKGNAVKYLARYSFRTAIANSRIVSFDDGSVTFRYKDYADGSKEKELTVTGVEFIRRFLQHIPPSGFHRMRLSGYLSNCCKSDYLKLIHRLRNVIYIGNPYRYMKIDELMLALYNRDICACPNCNGRMERLPRGMPCSQLPLPAQKACLAMC
ncbi:MAG: IS91 family transposase [Lachnospiraceae bacterium]|nr:IS91 family transposase [Lachnospiraceae bacterium]